MPHGFGRTGTKVVKTPVATHNKIFQNGDRMPAQKNQCFETWQLSNKLFT